MSRMDFGNARVGLFKRALIFFLVMQGLCLCFSLPFGLLQFGQSNLAMMPAGALTGDLSVLLFCILLFHGAAALVLAVMVSLVRLWRKAAGFDWERAIIATLLAVFVTVMLADIFLNMVGGQQAVGALKGAQLRHLLVSFAALLAIIVATVVYRGARQVGPESWLVPAGMGLCALTIALAPFALWQQLGALPPPVAAAKPGAGAKNILLITIDAASAPIMSLYGNALPTTPRLSAFARNGVVFDAAFATSNFTTTTIPSLLSGTAVHEHGVLVPGAYMTDRPWFDRRATIPSVLAQAGYRVGAVTQTIEGDPRRLRLEGRGDVLLRVATQCDVITLFGLGLPNSNISETKDMVPELKWILRAAAKLRCSGDQPLTAPDRVYTAATALITSFQASRQPWFVWVHTFPPHDPYKPPSPYWGMFRTGRTAMTRNGDANVTPPYAAGPDAGTADLLRNYSANMRYADDRLGDFLENVERRGVLRDTIVVVTSDHGEEFGRWLGHIGPYLDNSLIHIPLVISAPGLTGGKRFTEPVSQADIAPTLLDLAGIAPPRQMSGKSLAPLLTGRGAWAARTVLAETLSSSTRFGPIDRGTVTLIFGDWQYVHYLRPNFVELLDRRDAGGRDFASYRPDLMNFFKAQEKKLALNPILQHIGFTPDLARSLQSEPRAPARDSWHEIVRGY